MLKDIIKYLNDNKDDIVIVVNNALVKNKQIIKNSLLTEIKKYITPIPIHYVCDYSNCTYDYSGELVEDGYIDLNQTVEDFLQNEYSGTKMPTFTSHYGYYYNTYANELEYLEREISNDILLKTIRSCINEHFNCIISEDDFDTLWEHFDGFDDIYADSNCYDFDCGNFAWEFTEISKLKLNNLK